MSYHIPRYEELPDLKLFVDQIVTYIDTKLDPFFVDEKIITSSMINNYVKQGIVDPPVKKKYGRTHMVYFIVVCLLKKSFSLDEIDTIIKRVISDMDIPTAYNYFCDELEVCLEAVKEKKPIAHTPYYSGKDELVYICQSIVLALTYKIYAQEALKEIE
ncbi:MAG: DUF1836 domain-containing protein [Holdemanella sp.]|nr:DUF1836 domain-containing protein [Holdemanella sp.]